MNKYIVKLNGKSSINVCEQSSCNEVTFVSFCDQDEVMPSRSKTVGVTVEVWKELPQDMMLIVHDALEQTFVGVFNELCRCGKDRGKREGRKWTGENKTRNKFLVTALNVMIIQVDGWIDIR